MVSEIQRRTKVRLTSKRHYDLKPAYYREKARIGTKQRLANLKVQIFNHYSCGDPKCAECGSDNYEALQLDHINNDGYEHRKEVGNGLKLYAWIVKNNFPPIFQLLCANCNIIKHKRLVVGVVKSENRATINAVRNNKNRKLLIFNHYCDGDIKCKCGEDRYDALQLDHIGNDGNKHRLAIPGGKSVSNMHKWIVRNNFPPIFQVLCANCNFVKGKQYMQELTESGALILTEG